MSPSIAECLSTFSQCVEALRVGVKDDTAALCRRIKAEHGQEAAEIARTEIIRYAKSGRPTPRIKP